MGLSQNQAHYTEQAPRKLDYLVSYLQFTQNYW